MKNNKIKRMALLLLFYKVITFEVGTVDVLSYKNTEVVTMKAAILTLILVLASLSAPNANAALIMSGLDDTCENCTLSDSVASTYVSPNGTALEGSIWIQDINGWGSIGSYTILEADLDSLSQEFFITSLFVSFDDSLIIASGNNVLFNSLDYSFVTPWKGVIDVISLTGALKFDGSNGLSFIVNNTFGPTGVIWKGEITAVSAPTQLGFMGLCLMSLFALRNRKKLK